MAQTIRDAPIKAGHSSKDIGGEREDKETKAEIETVFVYWKAMGTLYTLHNLEGTMAHLHYFCNCNNTW